MKHPRTIYSCVTCLRAYTSRTRLNAHYEVCSDPNSKVKVEDFLEVPDETTYTGSALLEVPTMKSEDPDKGEFVCDVCGRDFAHKRNLSRH